MGATPQSSPGLRGPGCHEESLPDVHKEGESQEPVWPEWGWTETLGWQTGTNVTRPCAGEQELQVAQKGGAWMAGPGACEGGRNESVQGRPWRGRWDLVWLEEGLAPSRLLGAGEEGQVRRVRRVRDATALSWSVVLGREALHMA